MTSASGAKDGKKDATEIFSIFLKVSNLLLLHKHLRFTFLLPQRKLVHWCSKK
jgi:hypothetical protein